MLDIVNCMGRRTDTKSSEQLSLRLKLARLNLGRIRLRYYQSLLTAPSTPWYLYFLALAPLSSSFAYRIWRDQQVLGMAPNRFALIVTLLIAVVLWVRFRSPIGPQRLLTIFFALWTLSWGLAIWTGFSTLQDWLPHFSELLVTPLAAVLIAWRPPDSRGAMWVAKTLAVTLAVLIFTVWLLERWEEIWYWQQPPDVVANEVAEYWLFLNPYFDIEGRWYGLLDHPNDTALWAAAGTIIAVATRAWKSAVILGIALLLTGSRSSLLALLIGLFIIAAYQQRAFRLGKAQRRILITIGIGLLAFGIAWVVILNPGLTGRTSAWSTYWVLGLKEPFFGVGDSGVREAITSGVLPGWAGHAHNLWLDVLVKFGVVTLAIFGTAVILGAVLAVQGARSTGGLSAALITYLVVTGLTERNLDPRWFWLTTVVAWLSVLMSTWSPKTNEILSPPSNMHTASQIRPKLLSTDVFRRG